MLSGSGSLANKSSNFLSVLRTAIDEVHQECALSAKNLPTNQRHNHFVVPPKLGLMDMVSR
jgi:hypothetical protein